MCCSCCMTLTRLPKQNIIGCQHLQCYWCVNTFRLCRNLEPCVQRETQKQWKECFRIGQEYSAKFHLWVLRICAFFGWSPKDCGVEGLRFAQGCGVPSAPILRTALHWFVECVERVFTDEVIGTSPSRCFPAVINLGSSFSPLPMCSKKMRRNGI